MKDLIRNKKIYVVMSIILAAVLAIGSWQFHNAVSVKASGVVSIGFGQGLPYSESESEPVYQDPVITNTDGNIYQVTYTEGKITIGDESKGKYEPSLNISKWDDEACFKLAPQFITGASAPLANLSAKSITSGNAGINMEYKTTNLVPGFNEYGGLDMILTLNSKPQVPLSFTYSNSNITAYLQPVLTKEYQDGYSDEYQTTIKVSETIVTDTETGKVLVSRPDYVVNSIAFYAEDKNGDLTALGGKNYKTGKVGQLYRHKAIDAKGNWAWMDWAVEGNAVELQDTTQFLDTAVYPVTIQPAGDTFGYTTHGASIHYCSPSWIITSGITYHPAMNGTATSITIYGFGETANSHWQAAIYNGTDLINNGSTSDGTFPGGVGEYTAYFSTPPTLNAANNYYLAFNHADANNAAFYYDSEGTIHDMCHYASVPMGTWPDPAYWNDLTTFRKYSIWVTYTPTPNISNTPSSYNMGVVIPNSTISTGLGYFTVTNNSGSAVNITIGGTDVTGGTTWTLSDTATPGTTTFGMKAGLNGGLYDIIIKKTAPFNTLKSNLGSSSSQLWGFQLLAPTAATDTVQKTGTITLTATTP